MVYVSLPCQENHGFGFRLAEGISTGDEIFSLTFGVSLLYKWYINEIRKKNKSCVDIGNSTLYRIKPTLRKSHPKKEPPSEHRTISVGEEYLQKKSFYKRDPVTLGKGRNIKTIEK